MTTITQRLREIAKGLAEDAAARRGLGLDKAAELYSMAAELEAPAADAVPVAMEPDCWAILTPNGSRLVSSQEAAGRQARLVELVLHMAESKRLRDWEDFHIDLSEAISIAQALKDPK